MTKLSLLILFATLLFIPNARAQNNARFSDIKPGMKDGRLERDAVIIANERAVNLRCPEEYTKAKILSYDWIPVLDRWGYIVARKIHMELYCEFPDGHCGMADFIFSEKVTGVEEYSRKLQFEKSGATYTVECETD